MTEGADIKAIQKKLWETEVEILDAIHEVCTRNNLRYSLAYGTLLGAARHKGFIPWDDDVDVMMPREDYDKLKEIWADEAPEGFILQDDEMYDDLVNNFAKIRKDNTTFIQFEYERNCTYHTGIYVDIFPADRVAPGKIKKKLQYFLYAINLLFNRGYTSGTGGIVGFVEKLLLKIVRKKHYRKFSIWAGKRARRWNGFTENEYVFPCTIRDCKRYYPNDLFKNRVKLEFENKKYCAFKDYDLFLTTRYGDYMQLPPEEERVWKHHPIIIDFEHSYEELVEESKI